MTTLQHPPTAQQFCLRGISWQTYVTLRDAPENDHVRMTYDRGDLQMMSPSKRHEQRATVLDLLIHAWAEELGIDILGCGMMTCRREDLDRGFEPDKCYYVQHAAAMRAKEELDLTADPPPELAVEIDVSRKSTGKLDLYAAFGIPEVWRYDDVALTIYRLDPGRQYEGAMSSAVFPGFPLAEAERRLGQVDTVSETTLVKSFRQWIRANALPRPEGDQGSSM